MDMKLIKTASLTLLMLFSYTTHAGDNIGNHAILPQNCEPTSTAYAEQLDLGFRGWTFKYNKSGYAFLFCTIPIIRSQDGNFTFTSYRVLAEDPDLTGTNSRVTVSFYETTLREGSSIYYGTVDTNIRSIYSPPSYFGYPSNIASWYFSLQSNKSYNFFVTLYRRDTSTATPEFRGITFSQLNFD